MTTAKRLMLVEDSPTQAARLRKLFEEGGLKVWHVSSAESALEQLEAASPDVIVLDYHLPGMNGHEFCHQIRLNVNTRAIPVLMLTAEESDTAEMQGLASGADDYVAKSADFDVLLVRVLALLRKPHGSSAVVNIDNRFSRARLLAIDDSPTYLRHIAEELKAERYIVETIDDPVKALERLKQSSFDCVLVDFEMPGLDGAAVCRAIRSSHRDNDPEIVLVMLTSHDDKRRMTLSFEAGADDYIAKAADMAVTKARIRALLRRKFLVEENRHILEEIKEKELDALRARAAREAAEVRAEMADQLAAANRRLAVANQELEQFAYSAAHDLQEPLRKISIFGQLLQTKVKGKVDAEVDQFLGFCMQGAAQMDQLIKDLLLYAGATKSDDTPQHPVDLQSALTKALQHLEVTIADAQAQVTAGPLPCVFVQEIRIQQLFQNLIGNAIKYRRPDVRPEIRIAAEKKEGLWTLSVADNGIGIGEEYWPKVFDLFERLDPVNYPGTGLGLAICKRIVDQLGGSIWVESQLGKGSTFFFSIPESLEACPACVNSPTDVARNR
jgi:two-component system NtrC family sensor kinase